MVITATVPMLFTATDIPPQNGRSRIKGLSGITVEPEERRLWLNFENLAPEHVEAGVEIELLAKLRGGEVEENDDEDAARDGGQDDGEEAVLRRGGGNPRANVRRHTESEREGQEGGEQAGAAFH